jgi:hypothetical protein
MKRINLPVMLLIIGLAVLTEVSACASRQNRSAEPASSSTTDPNAAPQVPGSVHAATPPPAVDVPAQRPLKLAWSGEALAYNAEGAHPDDIFVVFQFVDDNHLKLVELRRTMGHVAPRTAEVFRLRRLPEPISPKRPGLGFSDGTFAIAYYQYSLSSYKGSAIIDCTDAEMAYPGLTPCTSALATSHWFQSAEKGKHSRAFDQSRLDRLAATLFDSDTSAKLLAFKSEVSRLAAAEVLAQQQAKDDEIKRKVEAQQSMCEAAGLGDRKSVIAAAQLKATQVAARCKAAGITEFPTNTMLALRCQLNLCAPFGSGAGRFVSPVEDLKSCSAVGEQGAFEQNYARQQGQINQSYTPMMFVIVAGAACPALP